MPAKLISFDKLVSLFDAHQYMVYHDHSREAAADVDYHGMASDFSGDWAEGDPNGLYLSLDCGNEAVVIPPTAEITDCEDGCAIVRFDGEAASIEFYKRRSTNE